jgi:hypothetical protein
VEANGYIRNRPEDKKLIPVTMSQIGGAARSLEETRGLEIIPDIAGGGP